MSLLQINTAIPLAEPLLEEEQEQERYDHHVEHHHGAKFIALGAVTGFLIQIVSFGSYTFLLLHYQAGRQVGDAKEDAVAATTAASMNGFLSHEQPQSMTYVLLNILTRIDFVVYTLILVAFTYGMTCIRAQFFGNNDDDSDNEEDDNSDEDDEEMQQVSVTKSQNSKNIKRQFVFLFGVYFLVGIVSGVSAIDICLGFPILRSIMDSVVIMKVLISVITIMVVVVVVVVVVSFSNTSGLKSARMKKI